MAGQYKTWVIAEQTSTKHDRHFWYGSGHPDSAKTIVIVMIGFEM
jgi:hypothetical protein